jgi:PAS domain S-box-containing protein
VESQERVREEQERYRHLFNFAPDAYLVTDEAGVITQANRAAESLLGLPRERLQGHPLHRWLGEGSRVFFRRARAAQRRAGEQLGWETVVRPARGAAHPVEVTILYEVDGVDAGGLRWLVRDVTERVRAEEALRKRTAELEQRNAELDAFAYTVAHDLKNPLALVGGYAELLLEDAEEGEVNIERWVRMARHISERAYQMDVTIHELLLLAQTTHGEVERESLDMGEVVAGALARVEEETAAGDVAISVPEGWPRALGYRPWVEAVWANYLSNALKYGGEPPRVTLGYEKLAGDGRSTVRFWVRDHGPGLAPEEQERLFAPFTQLHKVGGEGHGLGLSIVRRIVERLGGEVGVESAPGEGATFWFTLPKG